MMSTCPAGLLLAAGLSRRFGRDKLLETLPDGRPVAVAAAQALVEGLRAAGGPGPGLVVVLRPEQVALQGALAALGLEIVEAAPGAGMGDNLAAGVRAVGETAGAGYLIALADMPWLPASAVSAVARALMDGARLAAPQCRGRRGHPVGLDAGYRAELAALAGDHGARRLIERDADHLRPIPFDDAGVLLDVDRPTDLDSASVRA